MLARIGAGNSRVGHHLQAFNLNCGTPVYLSQMNGCFIKYMHALIARQAKRLKADLLLFFNTRSKLILQVASVPQILSVCVIQMHRDISQCFKNTNIFNHVQGNWKFP